MSFSKETKAVVVDCQIFQTFSWNRGMGKYSIELLKAIAHERIYDTKVRMHFLFNAALDHNEEAESVLMSAFADCSIDYVQLELPREPRERNCVQEIRLKNKEILNAYIKQDIGDTNPDFLILSLYLDEVCSVFPDGELLGQALLLYYDSIPLLYHERYGSMVGFFDNYYLPHTATVFEADKVLTISKTVANDLRLYLGIIEDKIYNIDGAPIPRGANKPQKPKDWQYKPGEFVLMPTGQELRKNNDRAVEAFEAFVKETGRDLNVVITSNFTEEGRSNLRQKSSHVDFTGNVSEAELLWLYQNCRFVLFPPEYEGLGLPVLEAVEQGKVVACSDIAVFREMSDTGLYFFDPLDVESIKDVLIDVDKTGGVDADAYDAIAKHYTWPATAQAYRQAIAGPKIQRRSDRPKIAIFAPDVSGFSAIGKDIGELHDVYSQFFDVDYYFDKGPSHRELRPNFLKYAAVCRRAADFRPEDADTYDALVYHIGNSEYHCNIARVALRHPGYVVLHDTHLSGLYNNLVEDGYITSQRLDLEKRLELRLAEDATGPAKRNMSKSTNIASIVNNQKGVIVHSEYAQKAVKAKLMDGDVPVVYAELPFATPVYPDIVRRRNKQKVSIAFAGIIAPIKGIDIMEKIVTSDAFSNCHINIFGFSSGSDLLDKLSEYPHVCIVTNPSDFKFQQMLADSDIMVNVRLAYRGETSGGTISHMRYGGIAIVRDFGWFSELPDDVVIKVKEPEQTLGALEQIVSDAGRRDLMVHNVRKFMQTHHRHDRYAKAMHDLVLAGNRK